MPELAFIAGAAFLSHPLLRGGRERRLDTPFGAATVFVGDSVAFVPRHGGAGAGHILPHRINHAAHLQALKDLGVREVLAVQSTGSLKKEFPPGFLLVPEDYLLLYPGPTVFDAGARHVTPRLDEKLRRRWLAAAQACGKAVFDGGVYWQSPGPRLETRAEIRMMARYADVVGMTMASEAAVAQELGLGYASLCTVDNLAHGIGETPLTQEEIAAWSRRNAETVALLMDACLS